MHGTQKTDRPLPGFVGGTLDRVDHVRTNPALLAQAFADPAARRLVLDVSCTSAAIFACEKDARVNRLLHGCGRCRRQLKPR